MRCYHTVKASGIPPFHFKMLDFLSPNGEKNPDFSKRIGKSRDPFLPPLISTHDTARTQKNSFQVRAVHMIPSSFSLGLLAEQLSAELRGDPECEITNVAPLDKAQKGHIGFLHNPQYRSLLENTKASAVILSPKDLPFYVGNTLVMENPYLGYAKVANLFAKKIVAPLGIHPSVVIGQNSHIAKTASLAPYCVIGDHVTIGEHAVVGPNCNIGDNVHLGDGTLLYAGVTIYHAVFIGCRVIIHTGAVIGADGFGIVKDRGAWYKIPQLGGVQIGDEVEIGANTTVDRGALEDTILERGVTLDNLIQVAHNVHIGEQTAIAAGTLIAGSTRIGKHCMIGGGAAISGHLHIADHVILTAKTEVGSSITEPGIYSSGMPAQPNREWRKNIIRFYQLDDIARRLRKLEKNND